MATATVPAPTPSQWASATLHLERRDDWRTVRIDGVRYVVLTSATSNRVYRVRADAAGCGCKWYERTGQQCAHMLALELAATADELAEQPAPAPKRTATTHRPCLRKACGAVLPPEWPYRFCDHCWERQRAVLDSMSA